MPDWLNFIFSLQFLRQMAAFIVILIVAWLLQFLLQRPLYAVQRRFVQLSWMRKLTTVIQRALWPGLAWLLSRLVVEIFQALAFASGFLMLWVVPFMGLWFLYRLVSTVLRVNLPAQQAQLWSRKVLLPVLLVVGILLGAGLLDDILQQQLTPGGSPLVTVGSILTGMAIVVLFFVLARGVQQFLAQVFLPQAGAEPALAHALAGLVTYSILVIGVIIALSLSGFNLTTLTVIAGGLSVGLGFGLQEIVNNFVSGFILMFERSIGPGDIIEVGDTRGIVQSIGIRSMIIRTLDNIELIIPNSRFLSETMTNLTRADPTVRIRISVGVSYKAKPREVEQALLEAAQHPYILNDPAPSVQFADFGESSLNFDLLVWTREPRRIPVISSDLRYSIWDALAIRNIDIPFPQRDIHIRSGAFLIEKDSAAQPNSQGIQSEEKE